MNERYSFGKRLREARRNRGLTQVELGARCNLGRTAISKFELGEQYPSMTTFIKLQKALGFDCQYMLTGSF